MVDFYERLIKRRRNVSAELAHETRSQGRQDVALSRIITVAFGIIGVTLAANVAHVGNLIEIAQKVIQTFTGPLLGIYVLGMFSRRATSRGALVGGILGSLTALYVAFFSGIAFFWPTVFGFVVTYVGGYVLSMVLGGTLSDRAQELTWRSVMRRPLPQDNPSPAAEVPPIMQPLSS
jgi:Na+/proline symporter